MDDNNFILIGYISDYTLNFFNETILFCFKKPVFMILLIYFSEHTHTHTHTHTFKTDITLE